MSSYMHCNIGDDLVPVIVDRRRPSERPFPTLGSQAFPTNPRVKYVINTPDHLVKRRPQ